MYECMRIYIYLTGLTADAADLEWLNVFMRAIWWTVAILEHLEAFFEHLTSNYAMKVLTLKKCQKCNTYCTFGTSGRAQRFQVPAKMGYI